MTTTNPSVGTAVRASEAHQRVDGHLRFVMNHEVPGMLYARVFRSTSAHARITRLDVSQARDVPGVVDVLTGRDLVDASINPYYGPVFPDRSVVAIDRVRYAGEPVAVVIAEDPDAAHEAVSRIEVEYDELPVYVDPESAVAPEAVPIHETVRQRGFLTYPDLVLNTDAGKNIFNHFKLRKGDVEQGFREADEIFEGTFRTPHQQHVSLEPHVAICQIKDGQATIWSSASSPFTARFQVAETLGVPESQVRIITWHIGGAYGGKSYPRIEPLIAVVSWKVGGRPVRLEFSRTEEFYTITRHQSVVTVRTGVKRDGTITARKVRILWGAGAYADISPRTIKNGGWGSIGPYRVPNAWVDSYAVYTNTTPSGGYRGYAIPQVCWAYENQMDEIAHALSIDPLELRRRNMVHDGDTFSTGQVMHDIHYEDLLGQVSRAIRWEPVSGTPVVSSPVPPGPNGRSRGETSQTSSSTEDYRLETRDSPRLHGKGIAMTVKGTVTPSTSTASLKLNEDGSLSLLTSTTEIGQGSRTALAQIAADSVGVPFEQVYAAYPDTEITPWDQTTSSSRSTMMMGGAIEMAAVEIQRQLRELAAPLLEASPDDLEVGDGEVRVRGVPGRSLTYGQVVQKSRVGNILGSSTHATEGGLDPETGQGIATPHFVQSAVGVEVEIDRETGRVTVLDLFLATYAGKVIHPTFAELQSEGNVTFGLGSALYEEMVYDGGQVGNANLGDYMIPSFEDLPQRWKTVLLEDPSGNGHIHGLGEAGVPPISPAISNAIFNACGVRIRELPITPERVLRALRELEGARSQEVLTR